MQLRPDPLNKTASCTYFLKEKKNTKKNSAMPKTKVDDKHRCKKTQALEGTLLLRGRQSTPRWRVWTSDLEAGPLQ